MKKRNLLLLAVFTILAIASMIALTSSASNNKSIETPTCCKKKVNGCDVKDSKSGSGELIMDNMSRQFISIAPM